MNGSAGFFVLHRRCVLPHQKLDDIQHDEVDGIDEIVSPLEPLALVSPLAVVQQQQRNCRQHGKARPQGAVGLYHEKQGCFVKMYKKAGETAGLAVSPAKMITIRCLPMGNYFSLMASSNWMKRPTTINTKAVTIHPAVPTDWNIPPATIIPRPSALLLFTANPSLH